MNNNTLLLRQIHPSWMRNGRVGSQAFRPMPKDQNLLSVYDGDKITPVNSFNHFTETLRLVSIAVCAVSVAECTAEQLPARPDPLPNFPEHAVIDFTGLSNSAALKKSQILRDQADARGWLFKK
jgi:hypothetical protein